MILCFGDLETTGFSAAKGDRIIEVCLAVADFDTRRVVGKYVERINPLRSIPEKATAVHGIKLEDLRECPTWEVVAPKVQKILSKCDKFVAHNLDFDATFLVEELSRVGLGLPANIGGFCTMENARWASANGKNPKLGELCWALGVEYDPSKAHSAEYDVLCMKDAFFKGVDLGFFRL